MKNFSKLLMAATLLLGLAGTVKAADLPRSEYPRPHTHVRSSNVPIGST